MKRAIAFFYVLVLLFLPALTRATQHLQRPNTPSAAKLGQTDGPPTKIVIDPPAAVAPSQDMPDPSLGNRVAQYLHAVDERVPASPPPFASDTLRGPPSASIL